eukprot:7936687-Pyramimonas_sp.AAC.1
MQYIRDILRDSYKTLLEQTEKPKSDVDQYGGKYGKDDVHEIHKSPPGPVTYWGVNDRKSHNSYY